MSISGRQRKSNAGVQLIFSEASQCDDITSLLPWSVTPKWLSSLIQSGARLSQGGALCSPLNPSEKAIASNAELGFHWDSPWSRQLRAATTDAVPKHPLLGERGTSRTAPIFMAWKWLVTHATARCRHHYHCQHSLQKAFLVGASILPHLHSLPYTPCMLQPIRKEKYKRIILRYKNGY